MRRLVALALVFVPLAASAQDEKLAKEIRDATSKATKAIVKSATPPPPGPLPRSITYFPNPQARPLEALALLRAGGADERTFARKLLDEWYRDCVEHEQPCRNYELALAISAYEGLTVERIEDAHPTTVTRYEAKPIAADVRDRLELLTRTLIAGKHATFDGKGIGWSYDIAPWQKKAGTVDRARTRAPLRTNLFDNSNTQFSVLALHDAARGGVAIPPDVVRDLAQHFLLCATRTRGTTGPESVRWGYNSAGSQPSMTFAGLSSLGIARDLGYKDEGVESAIKNALPDLEDLITIFDLGSSSNGTGASYLLYSLEKALDTLDVRELGGKDWFAPLARRVLEAQGSDGLWASDTIDTCFFVLFLTRATVSKARLVDGRSTGGAGSEPLGEVYLPGQKKTIDAAARVFAYAEASGRAVPAAEKDAYEAVHALIKEGRGREACLLGPLASLVRQGGARRENANGWAREVCGTTIKVEDLEAWGITVKRLHEERDPAALRAALGPKSPLPVRALAASELARLPCPESVGAVISAADALASDPHFDTGAGSRCARTFADALTSLTQSTLPPLPEKGQVAASDLESVVMAAQQRVRRALDDRIDKAAVSFEKKDEDWPKQKLLLAGKDVLARMVDRSLFRLLRAVTGELIPDDADAWRNYLGR
jgi:hypothetical protein